MVRSQTGALIAVALIGAGCSWLPTRVETVTVNVPVEVARTPPPELVHCTDGIEAPKFVAPSDPAASSCLVPREEQKLVRFVDRALSCDGGWEAWATAPAKSP